MEPDEIVYAVGELYLKYRKAQQIISDQAEAIAQLESRVPDEPDEAGVPFQSEPAKRKKGRGGK